MTKYIFYIPDNLSEYLFADVRLDSDFDIVHLERSLAGKILIGNRSPVKKILRKLNFLDYFINMNFCYKLGKYKKLALNKEYVLIFVAGAASVVPEKMLENLSKRKNIFLALLLMDSYHASSPTAVGLRSLAKDKIWDAVYTFDEFDAEEFGWKNINKCYFSTSRLPDKSSVENRNITSDAFFVGGLKEGREKMILGLFKEGEKQGLKLDFVLSCMNKNQFRNRIYKNKITYIKKWIPYSKVLERTMRSNCIVEILQKNQQAQTLRYFEALYFNKKLFTNNRHVTELLYYNPEYMKYFENVSDIDFDWIKRRDRVDYGYKNDFSALALAKQIKSDFDNYTRGGVRGFRFNLFFGASRKTGGRICL